MTLVGLLVDLKHDECEGTTRTDHLEVAEHALISALEKARI